MGTADPLPPPPPASRFRRQGFPAARSGPAAGRVVAAGDPGRARPGAVPTSSTVSGMQIRYSFSSMVLPAPDPGKRRGRPSRRTRLAPGGGRRRWEPAGEAVSALRSAPPGCLRSAPEHVKLRVPVSVTPPPPSSQRSALPVVQSQGRREGRPAEDSSDQQPRAGRRGHQIRTCPAAGERGKGVERRSPRIQTNAQKSPSGSSSEGRAEPGEPPFSSDPSTLS